MSRMTIVAIHVPATQEMANINWQENKLYHLCKLHNFQGKVFIFAKYNTKNWLASLLKPC